MIKIVSKGGDPKKKAKKAEKERKKAIAQAKRAAGSKRVSKVLEGKGGPSKVRNESTRRPAEGAETGVKTVKKYSYKKTRPKYTEHATPSRKAIRKGEATSYGQLEKASKKEAKEVLGGSGFRKAKKSGKMSVVKVTVPKKDSKKKTY
jgi:hypothetical protein